MENIFRNILEIFYQTPTSDGLQPLSRFEDIQSNQLVKQSVHTKKRQVKIIEIFTRSLQILNQCKLKKY